MRQVAEATDGKKGSIPVLFDMYKLLQAYSAAATVAAQRYTSVTMTTGGRGWGV